MKNSILILILWIQVCFGQTNPNHVYVKPYVNSNGTYVPGHYRTAPNSTNRDNFSTKPNINPYTGEPGWIKPDNSAILNNSTPYINTPNLSNTSKSSGICNYSACKNPGKTLKQGDYGYSYSRTSYSNYCDTHSPKCGNPNCSSIAAVDYSGFSRFCSDHSHTCTSSGCYRQSRLLKQGDYGYSYSRTSYSNYCDTHSLKCGNPNCSNIAAMDYSGFSKFCSDHSHTCSNSGCYKQSRALKQGDYGYSYSRTSYSNYCDTHSPKCGNPNCSNIAAVHYSGFNKFCSDHSHTCSSSGCYKQSRTLKQGDYGYSYSRTSYSNYCDTHSPKCGNPNCSNIAAVHYSGFSRFCSDHSHTCSSSGCYKQSGALKQGDYGYSYSRTSYSNYCDAHSPKCKYPNCANLAMVGYNNYQSYCYEHK